MKIDSLEPRNRRNGRRVLAPLRRSRKILGLDNRAGSRLSWLRVSAVPLDKFRDSTVTLVYYGSSHYSQIVASPIRRYTSLIHIAEKSLWDKLRIFPKLVRYVVNVVTYTMCNKQTKYIHLRLSLNFVFSQLTIVHILAPVSIKIHFNITSRCGPLSSSFLRESL